MKKLFFMIVLAMTVIAIKAQESSLSARAGIGIASIVGGDSNTKVSLGNKIGISFDYGISKHFAIVSEFAANSKGFDSAWIDRSITMTYLQLAIMPAYKAYTSDNRTITVKAGPYYAHGIDGTDIQSIYGVVTNIFDKKYGFTRTDYGIMAGVAIDFHRCSLGVEYSRGFHKLDSGQSIYNQIYGVVFGYKFLTF